MESLFVFLIVLMLAVYLAMLAFWWGRRKVGESNRAFNGGLKQLQHEFAIGDRYKSSFMLMLGAEDQCKILTASWGLAGIGSTAWFGRWYADPDAAVLAIPEALSSSSSKYRTAWWRLLSLLVHIRPGRPLDAVIWLISVEDVLAADIAVERGLLARRKFTDILQRLGLCLPVYVIITGMEQFPGFQSLLSIVPKDAEKKSLGWTAPFVPNQVWQPRSINLALDNTAETTFDLITEAGALGAGIDSDLYCLPQRMRELASNLHSILNPVFQGNALGEAPIFRGLYWTGSSTGAAAKEDEEVSHATTFSEQLWRGFIALEQGIAMPVHRLLNARVVWHRTYLLVALILSVSWLGCMYWQWGRLTADADKLANLYAGGQEAYGNNVNSVSAYNSRKNRVDATVKILYESPRWQYRSWLYPSSWFSEVDQRLADGIGKNIYENVYGAIREDISDDLSSVRGVPVKKSTDNVKLNERPEHWENFLAAKDLVIKARFIEEQNVRLERARLNPNGPLVEWLDSADLIFKRPASRPNKTHYKFYNNILKMRYASRIEGVAIREYREDFVAKFEQLMRTWLDEYFSSNNFESAAVQLQKELLNLENSSSKYSAADIQKINASLDVFFKQVEANNSIWSGAVGNDLAPGYNKMLIDVSELLLFGSEVKRNIKRYELENQDLFYQKWAANSAESKNLLEIVGGNVLQVNEDLLVLHKLVEELSEMNFAVYADQFKSSALDVELFISGLDNAQAIKEAEEFFASYTEFVNEDIPKLPKRYRSAMQKVAGSAAALSVWKKIESDGAKFYNHDGSIPSLDGLSIISRLNDIDGGAHLKNVNSEINAMAIRNIKAPLADFERLLMIYPNNALLASGSGSGKREGLYLFGSSKNSVEREVSVLAKRIIDSKSSLDWLKAQSDGLSFEQRKMLSDFNELYAESIKYQSGEPSSLMHDLVVFVTQDLPTINIDNCLELLGKIQDPKPDNVISRWFFAAKNNALDRCEESRREHAQESWRLLAEYFNDNLSGKFPFSHDVQGEDADPDEVEYFMGLLSENYSQAVQALSFTHSTDALVARQFLESLKEAKVWLEPLFEVDGNGFLGLDVSVRWRTDRSKELKANQIIVGEMLLGNEISAYPSNQAKRLNWRVGDPVTISLRWAKDSYAEPVSDLTQSALVVYDREAEWQYEGSWALLRALRSHSPRAAGVSRREVGMPIELQVPVKSSRNDGNSTKLFMRLSLKVDSSKRPTTINALPVRAPYLPMTSAPRDN